MFENAVVHRVDPTLGILVELPLKNSSAAAYIHVRHFPPALLLGLSTFLHGHILGIFSGSPMVLSDGFESCKLQRGCESSKITKVGFIGLFCYRFQMCRMSMLQNWERSTLWARKYEPVLLVSESWMV